MRNEWRLILDGKHDGYTNMAIDETLLLSYSHQLIPTLRIYGWNAPFVSLGYSQRPEAVLNFPVSLPFVRRMTGGSAILHDEEITYSLVCSPSDLNLSGDVRTSYRILASFLKTFYRHLGLEAYFAYETRKQKLGVYGQACFASCQHYDMVIGGKKIGGNAQRRKRDVIFQHGSIPQKIDFELVQDTVKNTDGLKQKATDLQSETGKAFDFSRLAVLLAESFEEVFGIKYAEREIFAEEHSLSLVLCDCKYRTQQWNLYRQTTICQKALNMV